MMRVVTYPYSGSIHRMIETVNDSGEYSETDITIYEGKMDATLSTAESGVLAQTANYVISIPLEKDSNGKYKVPKKNDIINIDVLGDEFMLTVDNYMPSQLDGVTIYASRGGF